MAQILQDKSLATKFQILVEIAAGQPDIQQKDIARRLNVTPQWVSEYIVRLVEDGWVISEGRSKYRITKEGVDWLLKGLREMQSYFTIVEQVARNITVCAVVADCDLSRGQTVGLVMRDGLLFATDSDRKGAKGIAVIGFSLYCRLLAEAVEEQKAKRASIFKEKVKPSRLPPPTIDLPLSAYIPEEYVADLNTRLSLYQALVKVEAVDQVEDLASEFSDRFGTLPIEIKNLLYAVKIKALAAKAGIESISTQDGQIILRLFPGMQFNKQKLEPLRDGIRLGITQLRLNPKRLGSQWQEILEEIVANMT